MLHVPRIHFTYLQMQYITLYQSNYTMQMLVHAIEYLFQRQAYMSHVFLPVS